MTITTPLINSLNFDGIDKYGNYIIVGRAAEIPGINSYTRRYLYQLSKITRSLTYQSQTISLEEYIKEVRRLRESTSFGTSNFTPAIVNTESLDPELAEIGWQKFNLPR